MMACLCLGRKYFFLFAKLPSIQRKAGTKQPFGIDDAWQTLLQSTDKPILDRRPLINDLSQEE